MLCFCLGFSRWAVPYLFCNSFQLTPENSSTFVAELALSYHSWSYSTGQTLLVDLWVLFSLLQTGLRGIFLMVCGINVLNTRNKPPLENLATPDSCTYVRPGSPPVLKCLMCIDLNHLFKVVSLQTLVHQSL